MKTINIAVCISGQARTWRTAKDNILNYFDNKFVPLENTRVNVDYFIHTWDTNSLRDKTQPRWENKDVKIDNPNEEEEIRQAFRPAMMEYEEYNPEVFLHAWQGLFYSFMKSVLLKRRYEIQNDFVYDIVVKMRFDINFVQEGVNPFNMPLNKFIVHKCVPFVAYASSPEPTKFPLEFNYNVFDDVYFYSDSPTMDLLANVYRWYKELSDIGRLQVNTGQFVEYPEFYYGPGSLLYKHMINWGIHPFGIFSVSYYVVRKEAEDKKLNSIRDWKEIRYISNDWYINGYFAPVPEPPKKDSLI